MSKRFFGAGRSCRRTISVLIAMLLLAAPAAADERGGNRWVFGDRRVEAGERLRLAADETRESRRERREARRDPGADGGSGQRERLSPDERERSRQARHLSREERQQLRRDILEADRAFRGERQR